MRKSWHHRKSVVDVVIDEIKKRCDSVQVGLIWPFCSNMKKGRKDRDDYCAGREGNRISYHQNDALRPFYPRFKSKLKCPISVLVRLAKRRRACPFKQPEKNPRFCNLFMQIRMMKRFG